MDAGVASGLLQSEAREKSGLDRVPWPDGFFLLLARAASKGPAALRGCGGAGSSPVLPLHISNRASPARDARPHRLRRVASDPTPRLSRLDHRRQAPLKESTP